MSPRATRIFHALLWAATALRPSDLRGNRLAVVNNFAHAKQLEAFNTQIVFEMSNSRAETGRTG